MLRRLPQLAALAALIVVAAALLGGCDSDDEDTTTTGAEEPPAKEEEKVTGPPVGPPPTEESLEDAEKRIDDAVAKDDCEAVLDLYGIASTEGEAAQARCNQLTALAEKRLGDPELQDYGDLAGVIDWDLGDRVVTLVLVREDDGLYRLALTSANNVSPTSEGELNEKAADEALNSAMKAFKDGDCKAFLKVLSPVSGKDEETTCDFVKRTPLADVKQEPKLLGGNDKFAFYTLKSPVAHYTFLLVAQKQGGDNYDYLAGYQTALPQPGGKEQGGKDKSENGGGGEAESGAEGGQSE